MQPDYDIFMKALLNFCYILYRLIKDLSGFLWWLFLLADSFPYSFCIEAAFLCLYAYVIPQKHCMYLSKTLNGFTENVRGFQWKGRMFLSGGLYWFVI